MVGSDGGDDKDVAEKNRRIEVEPADRLKRDFRGELIETVRGVGYRFRDK